MEGPSKAEIAFEDRKDGSCGVSYVVQEPGGCPHGDGQWACLTFQMGFLLTSQADGWGCRTDSSPEPLLSAPSSTHTPGNACQSSELSPDPRSLSWDEAGVGMVAPLPPPILGPVLTGLPSPGDYEVSIKFNDEHIPDSPFVVPVASLSDDARRLTVTSLQVCVQGWDPSAALRDGKSQEWQADVARGVAVTLDWPDGLSLPVSV